MNIWRELDDKEQEEFRQWARDNYNPGEPIPEIWHPVIRNECIKMNIESHDKNNRTKETS